MIPYATTTISVLRVAADDTRGALDPEPPATAVASAIRAHIYPLSGTQIVTGGTQEDVRFRLDADPCDIQHTDTVRDEVAGITYRVIWARPIRALGLDHVEGELRITTGEV